MFMLRIEHPVADFDGWKKAFDSDPVGREKIGRAPVPDPAAGR